jgi:drug/metabolite transporter (DMT)-like permease
LLYFAALPFIGAVRAALLANLEPVVAILAAITILGERPSAARFAGIGLVLAAITVLQFFDRRARAKGNSSQ